MLLKSLLCFKNSIDLSLVLDVFPSLFVMVMCVICVLIIVLKFTSRRCRTRTRGHSIWLEHRRGKKLQAITHLFPHSTIETIAINVLLGRGSYHREILRLMMNNVRAMFPPSERETETPTAFENKLQLSLAVFKRASSSGVFQVLF